MIILEMFKFKRQNCCKKLKSVFSFDWETSTQAKKIYFHKNLTKIYVILKGL